MLKPSIIIPCFNEETRLPIEEFVSQASLLENIDLYFVDDGSTDQTTHTLNELKNKLENTIVISLEKNKGKAEAIRYAILNIDKSKYDYVGYLDADLSTSISEMIRLTTFINANNQVIIGSRIKKLGSTIIRKPTRHILGRILATIVSSLLLKIPIYDTQCGAKLFAMPLAKKIFKEPFISRWLFDIELLLRIIQLKGTDYCINSIIEVPLFKWHDKGDSRIKFKDFINIPFELARIFFKY